ncbi:hypothetical protein K2173_009062 [Erythroxylum novogranatense]|uniref:Uncharacterized protein n=1 Tax=Erythroxylum novogranatense TaxID=1862640 RepID=A0AAV8TVR5_9ROSI|nr:hypothetical protein K2173_009062 [Erythroxylum novogranatense]
MTTKLPEPVLTRDMTSITHCNWSIGVHKRHHVGRFIKGSIFSNAQFLSGISSNSLSTSSYHFIARKGRPVFSSVVDDGNDPDDSEDDVTEKNTPQGESGGVDSELIRQNLERIVGSDDSTFSGMDLATLIRNKYGRSYDVQLIKKEFMGRNLLALNVMWKYMEQRSFPLTEEEYLLRLDDVANTLKCWGAVSHIRNSLAKVKERPRIGKAVSIFIDMDESGGRANEWIYK